MSKLRKAKKNISQIPNHNIMYAQVNFFAFSKTTEEIKNEFITRGIDLISSSPGFTDLSFIKVSEKEAIVTVLWEQESDAHNNSNALRNNWFAEHIRPFLVGERKTYLGEVLIDYPYRLQRSLSRKNVDPREIKKSKANKLNPVTNAQKK